jgi:hypothetical protein
LIFKNDIFHCGDSVPPLCGFFLLIMRAHARKRILAHCKCFVNEFCEFYFLYSFS